MRIKVTIAILFSLLTGSPNLIASDNEDIRFFSGLYSTSNSYSGYYGKIHEDFADNSYDVSHVSVSLIPIGIRYPLTDRLYIVPYISEIFERYAHFSYGNETSMYAFISSVNVDISYHFKVVKPKFFISVGTQINYIAVFTNSHIEDVYSPGFGFKAGVGCYLPIFIKNEISIGLYYNEMRTDEIKINSMMVGINFYW